MKKYSEVHHSLSATMYILCDIYCRYELILTTALQYGVLTCSTFRNSKDRERTDFIVHTGSAHKGYETSDTIVKTLLVTYVDVIFRKKNMQKLTPGLKFGL